MPASRPGRSLEDVHASVETSHRSPWRRLFAYVGPAYLVAVGYMDPGNWATDLEGGARFGMALLWVLLMSNLMAVLLQTLSARLGVVTGHDLAQACRAEYPPSVRWPLWILAEIAIAATDLAEVLGTIIALKLLFHIPMLVGCAITACDTILLLWIQKLGIRRMEAFILSLVATIGLCFLAQLLLARPELPEILAGFKPTLPADASGSTTEALLVAIGILGATVMPHNLYLHSALVQTRRIGDDDASKSQACRFNLIDSALALNAAFFVNAAILILSASVFHRHGREVASIEQAHELLPSFLGPVAPILFGVALLCAGQSSTLTGTLAGQIVMEGFLDLRLAPWLRRLITRLVALIPAVIVIALAGEGSTQRLLVLSQVVLSLQLAFAVIPLVQFTSAKRLMGRFATPLWGRALAWLTAALIIGLNGKLVLDQITTALAWARQSGIRWLGLPLAWWIGFPLVSLSAGLALLLLWLIILPFLRPRRPAWPLEPSLKPDWAVALQPRRLRSIAMALERSPADTDILNRALALARPGETQIILLHVVDTPLAGVFGAHSADRHGMADEKYLDEVSATLQHQGYNTRPILLHGTDAAAELVKHLRANPVDLLVVGSHGHGLMKDLLFGETVERVRHGLDIPMLITRTHAAAAD
jgi:manganese transport protein